MAINKSYQLRIMNFPTVGKFIFKNLSLRGGGMAFSVITILIMMEIIVLISPWSNEVYLLEIMWIVGNSYLNKKIYEIEPYYSLRGVLWMKLFIAVIMLAFNVWIIKTVGNIIGPGFGELKIFLAMPIIILLVFFFSAVFISALLIKVVMEVNTKKGGYLRN